MKNWLRKKMHNFIFPQDELEGMPSTSNKVSRKGIGITSDGETLSSEPLRMSIYSANGGVVIETRQYDRVKDRSINQLYVVRHGEDIADTVSKVITMESLRG
jgi:hypothetical protein